MLCSVNELNKPPSTVPAIPPTMGGKFKDFATVVPKAPNAAGDARFDNVEFACCMFASTSMMSVERQKGQFKLMTRLLNFGHKKACSMAGFNFIHSCVLKRVS